MSIASAKLGAGLAKRPTFAAAAGHSVGLGISSLITLWGAQTRSGSRGRAVFVNEPTETIPSADAERMGRIN